MFLGPEILVRMVSACCVTLLLLRDQKKVLRRFHTFEFPLFPRGRIVIRPKSLEKTLTKQPNLRNRSTLKKTG